MIEEGKKRRILLSLGIGIILSLSSLAYSRNLTPGIVGTMNVGYGFPIQWLSKTAIVLPPSPPASWGIYWVGLIFDILYWGILFAIVHEVYRRIKKED
ncbi:MAG: hypothetical protein ACE5PM_05485 [Candidatus Hydrothermarchaeales archaeon]